MTDRHAGYVVVLESAIREDDAEATIAALKQIRGVAAVRPLVNGWEVEIAKGQVFADIREKFFEFYKSLNL